MTGFINQYIKNLNKRIINHYWKNIFFKCVYFNGLIHFNFKNLKEFIHFFNWNWINHKFYKLDKEDIIEKYRPIGFSDKIVSKKKNLVSH